MNSHSRIYRGVIGGNMNRKTVVMMALSLILILCVFVGCDAYSEDLTGTWKYTYEDQTYGKCDVSITFDGMGNFTTNLKSENGEEITDRGTYTISDGCFKLNFQVKTEEPSYTYVKRVNIGTQEFPKYEYCFATDDGTVPHEFGDRGLKCDSGELREQLDKKDFPIIFTYRTIVNELPEDACVKVFFGATFYEDMLYGTENISTYEGDKSLVYSCDITGRGVIAWNDLDNWDWNAEGCSTDYVYSTVKVEDRKYEEMMKYELNGDKLTFWFDYLTGPCDFIKQ